MRHKLAVAIVACIAGFLIYRKYQQKQQQAENKDEEN
jgi:hypothetical protein